MVFWGAETVVLNDAQKFSVFDPHRILVET